MLVLNSCKSCQKKESKETVNNVYFPSFPDIPEGNILFVDMYGKRVSTENQNQIVNVVLPFWLWLQICDYVEGTETAVQSLTSSVE